MKRINRVRFLAWCGLTAAGVALLITIIFNEGQAQSTSTSSIEGLSPLPADSAAEVVGAMGVFRLDTETWQVIGFDGRVVEGDVNSPEEVHARHLGQLAALDPDQYEKSFPKTAERKTAIFRALQAAHNPAPVQEHLAKILDPGEAAAARASVAAILNPKTVTEEELGAFRKSAAGPWSDAVEPAP